MPKPCLKCKTKISKKDFNPDAPLYCVGCKPLRKSRAAMAILRVDFDKESKRLLTVLHREIERLLDNSHKQSLSKDESGQLISYIKLVSELRAIKLFEDAQEEEK